jgi:hypothetical protein
MGIIDYLRAFDINSKIEEISKTILKRAKPTIIPPDEYKDRFQRAVKKYFMPVYSDY